MRKILVDKRNKIPDLAELIFYQKEIDNKNNELVNVKVCHKPLNIMGKKNRAG